MNGKALGPSDLERLLRGASVLGTGGGGSFSRGRAILAELQARGLESRLLALEDLPAAALGVATAVAGGGLTHEAVERLEALAPEPPAVAGARALAAHLGRPVDFVYALEIGPQNTLEALRLAAFLGVPLVDGDCAGRAVPELGQTTLSLAGIPLAPFVGATFQGEVVLVAALPDPGRGEVLCRALAQAGGGLVCLTGFPVTGAQLRQALLPGTLSRCMALGALLGPGRRPAEALAAAAGGRVAFTGRALPAEIRLDGGFFRGFLDLEGSDAFAGRRYRIGIQNEFMWSWLDGRLDARCPDLICVVEADSGLGKVTYGHGFELAIEAGEALAVLHLPCAEAWRSARGRAAFPAPPEHGPA